MATVNGDRLAGETIDAVLLAGENRRTRTEHRRFGDVTLPTREGIDLARTMHASEETGTLTLVGYPATAGLYADASGKAPVPPETLPRASASPVSRSVSTVGPGAHGVRWRRPELRRREREFGGYDTGSVRWQRSMWFDDRVGSAGARRRVTASAAMNGSEYSIEGERLALTLRTWWTNSRAARSARRSGQRRGARDPARGGCRGASDRGGRQYSAGPRRGPVARNGGG